MPEYIKPNMTLPVSLHDARVTDIIAEGDTVVFVFADGIRTVAEDVRQTGYAAVTFTKVDFDFCSVSCTTPEGLRTGFEIMAFAAARPLPVLDIIDETYGYNQAKFSCNLTQNGAWCVCDIEIYYLGEMRYTWEM